MKSLYYLILIVLIFSAPAGYGQQILNNPPQNVSIRSAAEWEEVQALVVTWRSYPAILAEIIRYAQEECKVIVHASNPSSAQSDLINLYGVPIGPNVIFEPQPSNSLWIRDYGANTVYINDVDSLFLVDWKYNRPNRVQDDTIPRAYARLLNVNLVQSTQSPNLLVHTGGNFMSDGFGNGFSSELILEENPDKSEAQIDNIMFNYMGISEYIKMPVLPYDGIHHIDMHMKLLDEETLLFGQYPQGIADGPQIEANMLYVLDNHNSVFGTPYKIVRVVQPPDDNNRYPNQNGDYRTYSNAIFINKTVLLPVYEERYDTTALRVWRESLPGYRIVPIDCNGIIPAGGAIHCITHSVGVNDPLLISHQPLRDTYDTENDYVVNARIQHRSGILNAKLYYTDDTLSNFVEISMTLAGGSEDYMWTGNIPAQAGDTEIFYYIQANAISGKTQVRPIVAPEGWWKFNVLDTSSVVTYQQNVLEDLFSMNAFPNPSKGITCIPVNTDYPVSLSLEVFDITGRIVETITNSKTFGGENRFYINTQAWASGVYQIRATTPYGSVSQKLIVR
ncbi:MAG: agmatine deiminase family protein [Bacteroidia bacterium]